jgi:hypothetical protein
MVQELVNRVPSTVTVNKWVISFGRHVSSNSIHMGLSHTTVVKVTPPAPSSFFFFYPSPWLGWLVANLLSQGPKFDPRPIHVTFLIDEVALRQGFLWVLQFFPISVSFHQHSIFIHISRTLHTIFACVIWTLLVLFWTLKTRGA